MQTILYWGLTVTVAPTAFHMAIVAPILLLKRVALVKFSLMLNLTNTDFFREGV